MGTETLLRNQGESEGLYADVCKIIASAQSEAYRAINVALVQRNLGIQYMYCLLIVLKIY